MTSLFAEPSGHYPQRQGPVAKHEAWRTRKGFSVEVLAAKDNLIALLDEDLRGGYEKMRGLLSYGIAMGAASPDVALLFDSLGDYLDARSDSDRKAASKAVSLCLKHGNFGEDDDSDAGDEILTQFEAISDPEEASAFHKKHRAAILVGYESRKQHNS